MQRGIGENRVKSLGERQSAGVAHGKAQRRKFLPGFGHHFRGTVDAGNLRSARGDLGGKLARSAAEVENLLSALRRQPVEETTGFLPNKSVLRVIEFCV